MIAVLMKLLEKAQAEEDRDFNKYNEIMGLYPDNSDLHIHYFQVWMTQRTYCRGVFDAVKAATEWDPNEH